MQRFGVHGLDVAAAPDHDLQAMSEAPKPTPAPAPAPAIDATLRFAIKCVAGSGVVLALGALTFGPRSALGVLIGGAMATANLWLFALVGKAFLERKGLSAPWAAIALLKFFALLAGIFLIMRSGVVTGLSLAVGYGAMPIGITVGGLFGPKPSES